jgi:hypothetical protein
MLERDVGLYECVATNEHGTARQKQHVELADHPRVVEHLKETTSMLTKTVKLECQIEGVPYPDVKWYKDWQPLCATSRIKVEELVSKRFSEAFPSLNTEPRETRIVKDYRYLRQYESLKHL